MMNGDRPLRNKHISCSTLKACHGYHLDSPFNEWVLCIDDEKQTYSVQEAIDAMGFKWFQLKLSIVTGFCWMADSMEMMLLAILGPVLRCQWFIPTWKQAFLATLVLAGMLLISGPWGAMADRYGRKKTLILSTLLGSYFGFLTALSPSFEWIAVNRFLVGVAIGSFPQAITLYTEFLPSKARATCMICIEAFFSVGAAAEVALAKLVLPSLGWRYLLAFSAVPVFIFPMLCNYIPESAHYLLLRGEYQEAVKLLERVAKENGSRLPPGKLERIEADNNIMVTNAEKLDGLFSTTHRRTIIVFLCLGFCTGFSYFGLSLLVPSVLIYPDGCHGLDIVRETDDSCAVSCRDFTNEDYIDIIITSLADLPGLFIMALFMAFFGRRSSTALCSVLFASVLMACNICMTRNSLTFLLLFARSFATAFAQTLLLLVTEAFPTHIRGSAVGLVTGVCKLGGVITPYVAQVGTEFSPYLSFSLYSLVGIIQLIFSALLPPLGPHKHVKQTLPFLNRKEFKREGDQSEEKTSK